MTAPRTPRPAWTAGVIVIGDELLDGRRDTNGPAVEAALTNWGIEPRARLVLPDHLESVAEGVAGFLQRFEVVITCGGLGPRLKTRVNSKQNAKRLRRTYRVCGVGESQLQELLGPLSQQTQWPELSFLLDEPGEVLVILTARDRDLKLAQSQLRNAEREIRKVLGMHFIGKAALTLPAVIGQLLKQRQETLAVAESCTGGWISHRITAVPGSSAYFLEGVVTYSNESKIKRLKVPAGLIAKHGAVSEPVALAMAKGVRVASGADWALATTGIAGPGGGTRQKPVGTVCLALAGPRRIQWVQTQRVLGERNFVQRRAATLILDELRRQLDLK
jgi:nicotinamide-nucleotide amidase